MVRMRGEMTFAEPQAPCLPDHDHTEHELRDAAKNGLPAIANAHPGELHAFTSAPRSKPRRDEARPAVRHRARVLRAAREAVVAQPALGEPVHGDQRDALRGTRAVFRDAERNEVGFLRGTLLPALGPELGGVAEAEPMKIRIAEAHHRSDRDRFSAGFDGRRRDAVRDAEQGIQPQHFVDRMVIQTAIAGRRGHPLLHFAMPGEREDDVRQRLRHLHARGVEEHALQIERLLLERVAGRTCVGQSAAPEAGEAGEPVLSIQLYARLLARYPDSALGEEARAAVEAQKKKIATPTAPGKSGPG